MLSHWPYFTWKFFVILFHKILRLIFEKQPSCPRNVCTKHWRKLPNLTVFLDIFLYLSLLVLNFDFDLVLPFYFLKWSCYFIACGNLPNSLCHFWKQKLVFLEILHQSSVPSNITSLYFFSSKIIYFGQKEPIKMQIFQTFKYLGKNSSNCGVNFDKSIPPQMLHHTSLLWQITPL